MTDAFGVRAVLSVLLPATNAVVEPDMAALRPAGVTNQSYRFPFPGLPDTVEDMLELVGPALDMALACEPDRIVVAYSPEYMADGINAASQLRQIIEERAKIPITLASDAVPRALKALQVKRVGLVTPFLPETNRNVSSYFSAHGVSVVSEAGFSSAEKDGPTPLGSARRRSARLLRALTRQRWKRLCKPAQPWCALDSLTLWRLTMASRLLQLIARPIGWRCANTALLIAFMVTAFSFPGIEGQYLAP